MPAGCLYTYVIWTRRVCFVATFFITINQISPTQVQKSGSLSSNLSAKRLDEARRLLDSAAQSVNADLPPELIQDPQIQDNPLLRTIFPEKQAIAQSELTKLVKDSPIEEQKPIAENPTTTEPEIATEK